MGEERSDATHGTTNENTVPEGGEQDALTTLFAPFGDEIPNVLPVGSALKRLHPRLFIFSPFGTAATNRNYTRVGQGCKQKSCQGQRPVS